MPLFWRFFLITPRIIVLISICIHELDRNKSKDLGKRVEGGVERIFGFLDFWISHPVVFCSPSPGSHNCDLFIRLIELMRLIIGLLRVGILQML